MITFIGIIFSGNLTTLPPLEEEVEWKQHDGSAIQIKCLLCTNEGNNLILITISTFTSVFPFIRFYLLEWVPD